MGWKDPRLEKGDHLKDYETKHSGKQKNIESMGPD